MNSIKLVRNDLRPFESVQGSVCWDLKEAPLKLELRLFWYTVSPAGDREACTVDALVLDRAESGLADFAFTLPEAPWSMEGEAFSIYWALELLDEFSGSLAVEDFVVGPDRRILKLASAERGMRQARLEALFQSRRGGSQRKT